jgi:hypothetical protein
LSTGLGSKTLTIQTGLIIPAGQTVKISNGFNIMCGTATSYNSSTGQLVINVTTYTGSGTLNSWLVSFGNDDYKRASWYYSIQVSGIYDVYMYYEPNTNNCANVGVHVGKYFSNSYEGKVLSFTTINQRTNSNPGYWTKINTQPCSLYIYDVAWVQTSNYDWGPGWPLDGYIIADAVKLVCTHPFYVSIPPDIIIDNVDNDTGMSQGVPAWKRFTCSNMDRAFLNMYDDKGPSKVPFFVNKGCELSRFTATNNVGLLYAMGYNGLISIGSSLIQLSSYSYSNYTDTIFRGSSFGQAYMRITKNYRKYLQSSDQELLGAGTLKADAYKPYYSNLTISNRTITPREKDLARDSITLVNVTVDVGVDCIIKAGKKVTIKSNFTAVDGCRLTIVADPSLY